MMANANKRRLKLFLISGTDKTQMETRFPIKPNAATTEDNTPSVQNRHSAVTSPVK